MKVSVDISYYPLKVEYISPIKDFIKRINTYDKLVVNTNPMSTQIFGEFDEVMQAITREIYKSFELPHSIFVIKMINADLNKS
ncbi:MAG: hypothetical protein EOM06_05595 [Sphingobacteriia bacterium]|nr:hypothetical protein [Sphingobacteriia bacterium]HPE34442.1 YkoF family thiamine/hydroxymethylpyrimidine-binding protein [Bacteroidales bacterium]HPR57412.1 YkoF family thiamine/hydroxymethylpyrimidine-binding protein [Bacteroidales bacterium]HRW97493.1 YkoF family thiamine/hydroxymethylpyrimidine-binding protein [Bacteroidales bacterium]